MTEKKSEYEKRQETRLGGASVDLNKILKGGDKLNRMRRVYAQIGRAEDKKYKDRVTDERIEAIFKPDGVAAKKVRSWSKAHKAKQEANKIKAMAKYKGTGSKRGANLRKGQADGDKGRKLGAQERKK